MQGVEHRPVRALDPMELKRTDLLRHLIQAPTASSPVAARPARRLLRLPAHS
jgi:hypothetical protein